MKYITPYLETEILILKTGSFLDYLSVYEYDFTKLRDINGEFKYVKLDKEDILGFDTYALENDEVFDWIIYLKDELKPIGNITADREIKKLKAIELAFNLHPSYWGNGYMKEAIISILDYLFNNGYDNVLCGYSEGNIKSKRLNDKLGFKLYKIEKDAWYKDGIAITEYKTIINKDDFYSLYKEYSKKCK